MIPNKILPLIHIPLLLLLGLLILLQIGTGEYPISIKDTLASLLGIGLPEHDFIVNTLRLPRTLIGLGVGASLAVAGTLLQGITLNPLASPGVIGLNAGAGLTAVAGIVWLDVPLDWLPWMAFGGALLVALLSYRLAWKQGLSPIRMVLVGIGIAAICQGLITVATLSGNIRLVQQASIWMTGSLYGRSWEHFWPYLPWVVVFLPLAWLFSKQLDLLGLGDAAASGLGYRVHIGRTVLIGIAVALAGTSVATAGTIGFVGLVAPHLARTLVGNKHAILIPTAALLGGLLVLAADFAGRTVLAPVEIPCGLITAMIGGPYMIYLLLREWRSA
ncbi:iron ABC transporter permease [Paenibacillus sp. J22TS3]|uniref:FecCD family ABC transporter permease n=1 Tax=Paenibacillus sp. J22TS3 TaxID=2807192 RepID=UPI001B21B65A|nr:iron ABC transporter permease [Paenibacillus sp. J22TS3]GIP23237.1 iron ABC transporter permease [Paenibacillus sp. J22TS3]